MSSHFNEHKDHIKIYVRLTQRSHKDKIDGVETSKDGKSHLKVRVRAVPENGKANKSPESLLAKHLRVPKSCVAVISGSTSRLKTLTVFGEPTELLNNLPRK